MDRSKICRLDRKSLPAVMILNNYSVSKNDKNILSYHRDRLVINRFTYYLNVTFPDGNINNFNDAVCVLIKSTGTTMSTSFDSSDRTSESHHPELLLQQDTGGHNAYINNNFLSGFHNSTDISLMDRFNFTNSHPITLDDINMVLNSYDETLSPIPEPMYYTTYHHFISNKRDFEPSSLSEMLSHGKRFYVYNLKDLIDNSTKINLIDTKTIKNKYLKDDSIYFDLITNSSSLFSNMSESNTSGIVETMTKNYEEYLYNTLYGNIFIYDSSMGINVKSMMNNKNEKIGGMIYGKYLEKRFIISLLKDALNMFKASCEKIEKTFGNIRIYYSPSPILQNMKINFRDFPNKPINNKIITITTDKIFDSFINNKLIDVETELAYH